MPTQSKTAKRTTKPAKRKPAKAVGSDTGSTWEKTKKKRKKKMRKQTKEAFGRLVEAVVVRQPLPRFHKEILKSDDPVVQKIREMRELNKVKEKENWKKIPKLKTPIRATADDVVIHGHGNYGSRASRVVADTVVPDGVEFVLLAPLGSTLRSAVGCELQAGREISKLGMRSAITGEIAAHQPIVYKAGDLVPNLSLDSPFHPEKPLFDLPMETTPDGPKLIYMERNAPTQALDTLWGQVEAHKQPGKVLRVYWSACAAMPDASAPIVETDWEA